MFDPLPKATVDAPLMRQVFIVRRIVERHGGQVWAEGRPAQGASFFFSVPASAAA